MMRWSDEREDDEITWQQPRLMMMTALYPLLSETRAHHGRV